MDTDNLRYVHREYVHQIVLSVRSQTGMSFVSDTCPEHPLGGLCLVSRVDLLSLFPRNVSLQDSAVKVPEGALREASGHGGC